MASLLLTIFLLQLATHILNTFGESVINKVLWNIYNFFPVPSAGKVREVKQLKGEVVRLRTELNATSSQDEFAKWAKLRRQHDKSMEQLEKSKVGFDASQKRFEGYLNKLRWVGTRGLRIVLQFKFTKQPIFWIPQGWIPYYAEWLLSFPKAPLGAISIQVWWIACTSAIALAAEAVESLAKLSTESTKGKSAEKAPQKAERHPEKVTSEKSSSKAKEL